MDDNKSYKVLAVEDNDLILDIFTEYLEADGFNIYTARDGVEGYNSFKEKKPHIVLLDLNIPKMHGFDVLKKIMIESPDTPVIVVSATADINDAIKAIRLGAWDFITKPIVDLRVLGHAIKKALDRFKLLIENNIYREHLEELVKERTEELENALGLQQEAEKKVKTSLNEKEILLREIHHRVKNNLQVISSLLNLQSGYIQNPKALDILKESQNRVKSMALIHEKMYQSKDLAKIDFSEYIENLTNYLFNTYKIDTNKITCKMNINTIFFGVDVAIPCGLIINELVSNSIKYAFPENNKNAFIEIKFYNPENVKNNYTLIVKDNGVGFPENIDFKKSGSLGLELVSTLVEQLGGTIKKLPVTGTEFKIDFKLGA